MALKPPRGASDNHWDWGPNSVGKGTCMLSFWTTYVITNLRARRGEDGASLVEYALLVALIAVVCIVAVTLLGSNASSKFSSVGSSLG